MSPVPGGPGPGVGTQLPAPRLSAGPAPPWGARGRHPPAGTGTCRGPAGAAGGPGALRCPLAASRAQNQSWGLELPAARRRPPAGPLTCQCKLRVIWQWPGLRPLCADKGRSAGPSPRGPRKAKEGTMRALHTRPSTIKGIWYLHGSHPNPG